MQFSTALLALTSLVALTSAVPISNPTTTAAVTTTTKSTTTTTTTTIATTTSTATYAGKLKPYFAVTNFSWSKIDILSRYTFNVSFPQYVQVATSQNVYAVPGFTDAVNCTATFATSLPSSLLDGKAPIIVCGQPKNKRMQITSQLDTTKGQLFLTYNYNITINGDSTPHTYTGTQQLLKPIDVKNAIAFNTIVSSGKGISS